MGRSAGSGNAAWKASRMMTRCKKGNTNRKRCTVVRKDGSHCCQELQSVLPTRWVRCAGQARPLPAQIEICSVDKATFPTQNRSADQRPSES